MGMEKWAVLFSFLFAIQSLGTPLLQNSVFERAQEWMHRNGVMNSARRSVVSVGVFPESGMDFVYVVRLAPKGDLILMVTQTPRGVILNDWPACSSWRTERKRGGWPSEAGAYRPLTPSEPEPVWWT